MTSQRENAENIDLLASSFPLRSEPNYALGNMISDFLMLPGLRGFWPMSSVNENSHAVDLSGQTRNLVYNGNPAYSLTGLAPLIAFDGAGDYLSRADEAGLDILGTESYIYSSYRGLTIGGWFYPANFATTQGLMSKGDGATNAGSSYNLYVLNTGVASFYVFSGANAYSQNSAAIAAGVWHFIVGRFVPGVSVNIFVDGTWAAPAAAPASLNNTAAPLNIGAVNGGAGGTIYTGYASLCFLCAAAASDAVINNLYQAGRPLFGV